jgi:hypothetical protein
MDTMHRSRQRLVQIGVYVSPLRRHSRRFCHEQYIHNVKAAETESKYRFQPVLPLTPLTDRAQ